MVWAEDLAKLAGAGAIGALVMLLLGNRFALSRERILRREAEIARDKKAVLFEINAMIEAIKRGDTRIKERIDGLTIAYLAFKPHADRRHLKDYEEAWDSLFKVPMERMTLDRFPRECIPVLDALRKIIETC